MLESGFGARRATLTAINVTLSKSQRWQSCDRLLESLPEKGTLNFGTQEESHTVPILTQFRKMVTLPLTRMRTDSVAPQQLQTPQDRINELTTSARCS
jgi:hypothetical protein